jgi:hypothetical protein
VDPDTDASASLFERRILIQIRISEKLHPGTLQRRIRICIEVKIQELRRLKMNALDGR